MINKALPKKDKESKVKKKPVKTHGKKKAGPKGKTRYSYPSEKKPSAAPGRPVSAPPGQGGQQEDYVPPSRQPQQLPVDLVKLCSQLGIKKDTLVKVVTRCAKEPKLKGKTGFNQLMSSQAKSFSQKHGLDSSYWGRVYDAVVSTSPGLQ